jgi:hypothetical protein
MFSFVLLSSPGPLEGGDWMVKLCVKLYVKLYCSELVQAFFGFVLTLSVTSLSLFLSAYI